MQLFVLTGDRPRQYGLQPLVPEAFAEIDKLAKRTIGGSWERWWLNTPLPGVVWCNCPHMTGYDGMKVEDQTKADFEGRKRIYAFVEFIRANMPGFENCYVIDVAPQLGVRQTRLLQGEYVVTKDDVNNRVHFADTVEGIASTFSVKVGGILELNGLIDGEQIYTGMALKVPSDATYGANFSPLLNLPYAPAITPAPPYGSYVAPPGFTSFGVPDYAGDPEGGSFGQCTWWAAHKRPLCDPTMERLMDNPQTRPLVKNASKICFACCGGSPTPVSLTETISCSFSARRDLMASSRGHIHILHRINTVNDEVHHDLLQLPAISRRKSAPRQIRPAKLRLRQCTAPTLLDDSKTSSYLEP